MKRNGTLLLIATVTLVQACATARVKVAHEPSGAGQRYEQVAVPPFANGVGSGLPATAPENVAGAVIARLQKDHGGQFRSIAATPTNRPAELIVRGTITQYDPGSKALRFILIGLGAGRLGLDVALVDGGTGATLEQFSTSGHIMAGGVAGASMGIENMIDSAAEKISSRVGRYAAETDGHRQ